MTTAPAEKTGSKIYDIFSVRENAPAACEAAFSASKWRSPEGTAPFMERYGAAVHAPDPDMTVMFWANRYSRFFAFVHWALAEGYMLNASPEDVTVFLTKRPEGGEPVFEFTCSWNESGHSLDDNIRRMRLLSFYQQHVVPLFQSAAAYAGVRPRELWGQVVHAVPYFLDLAKVTESPDVQRRLDEDWNFLVEHTKPGDFQEKKHPFQYKRLPVPNPADEENPVYTKPTCCLAYKRSSQCCYRCPRMKPGERERLYQQYKENQK
ncbi:hypothetical protein [Salibacterium sp. K-3]